MNDLKSLKSTLATLRDEQSKVAARLADIGAERYGIETAAADRAAAVSAAEQNLVEELALEEMNEPADVEAARKALAAARAIDVADADTATRLRVLDTLKARFDAENQTLHEKAAALMAEIAAVEVEVIRQKADQLREDALEAMKLIARVDYEVPALRRLAVERGGSLPFEPLSLDAITAQYRMGMAGRNVAAELETELLGAA